MTEKSTSQSLLESLGSLHPLDVLGTRFNELLSQQSEANDLDSGRAYSRNVRLGEYMVFLSRHDFIKNRKFVFGFDYINQRPVAGGITEEEIIPGHDFEWSIYDPESSNLSEDKIQFMHLVVDAIKMQAKEAELGEV